MGAEEVVDVVEVEEDLEAEDVEEAEVDLEVGDAEEDLDMDMGDMGVDGEDAVGGVEDIMETTTITMDLVALAAHHMSFLNIFAMKTMIAIFARIVIMA
jgi:hypothetical protein